MSTDTSGITVDAEVDEGEQDQDAELEQVEQTGDVAVVPARHYAPVVDSDPEQYAAHAAAAEDEQLLWDEDLRAGVVNKIIRIDAVAPHPDNYNIHPDEQIGELRASDRRWGQVRSIVVQEGAPGKYLLVAGHGYWTARTEEGKRFIRADVIPATWTSTQIKGYLIADNLLQRRSFVDEEMLAGLVTEQYEAQMDLSTLGVSQEDYDDMLARLAPPPTLDQLEQQLGGEHDPADFWPVLKVKVPHGLKALFDSLMEQAPGDSEWVKLARLLQCVDTAALAQSGTLPLPIDPDELADGEQDGYDMDGGDPDTSSTWNVGGYEESASAWQDLTTPSTPAAEA